MAEEISLPESTLWRLRLQRLEALLTLDPVPGDETTTQELLVTAEQGDVDKFVAVAERHCHEGDRRLCLGDIRSRSRNSLLHIAAGLERDEILRAIINHFPSYLLAEKNRREDTALHLAARAGRAPAAQALIHRASDVGEDEMPRALVQAINGRGNTPLHEAAMHGHLEVVQILIREDMRPMYWENKEHRCPLSLAVEHGRLDVLRFLLAVLLEPSWIKGVPPVHVAILHRDLGMLKEIWGRNPKLFGLKDDRFGTPLHLAAYLDYCPVIRFLQEKSPSSMVELEYDRDGQLPIHVACKEGNVGAMKELLREWPNPTELINRQGQNILHICAKNGRASAVKYILGNAELGKLLINERDYDGNTPLHLATLPLQAMALLHLVWHKSVDLELLNNEGLTALDVVAREEMKITDSPRKKILSLIILIYAGAPTSKELGVDGQRNHGLFTEAYILAHLKGNTLKDVVNVRLVVTTLVATVTFAAGFAIPGGYAEGSGADRGMAQMLDSSMFHAFVICNTVAMYTAIIAVITWPWTQLGDTYIAVSAHVTATVAMMIALGTMSVAFMAGSYVILSKLTWLASLVLLLGGGALLCVFLLYVAMSITLMNRPYLRSIAFYITCLGVMLPAYLIEFPNVIEGEDSRSAGMRGTRTAATSDSYGPDTLPPVDRFKANCYQMSPT